MKQLFFFMLLANLVFAQADTTAIDTSTALKIEYSIKKVGNVVNFTQTMIEGDVTTQITTPKPKSEAQAWVDDNITRHDSIRVSINRTLIEIDTKKKELMGGLTSILEREKAYLEQRKKQIQDKYAELVATEAKLIEERKIINKSQNRLRKLKI